MKRHIEGPHIDIRGHQSRMLDPMDNLRFDPPEFLEQQFRQENLLL
jgi:hypothetical protein